MQKWKKMFTKSQPLSTARPEKREDPIVLEILTLSLLDTWLFKSPFVMKGMMMRGWFRMMAIPRIGRMFRWSNCFMTSASMKKPCT